MRKPKDGTDFEIFNEGWVADCHYCEAQFAQRTKAFADLRIKEHVLADHLDKLGITEDTQ